jgi:hypothetical protein
VKKYHYFSLYLPATPANLLAMVRARLAELKRQATSVTLEDFLTECRHTEITKVSPESDVL